MTDYKALYEQSQEENKKLKEHLDKSREVSNRLIAENNTTMPPRSALYRENKKLKEEINKLQKENEKVKGWINDALDFMNECCEKSEAGLYMSWETRGIESRLNYDGED